MNQNGWPKVIGLTLSRLNGAMALAMVLLVLAVFEVDETDGRTDGDALNRLFESV